MNSCDRYEELICRLVDDEVSREEYAELLAHMKTCSRCSALYAVFYDLSESTREVEKPQELPEGLHENIMAGVRRSEMAKKNRRARAVWLRTALTAAACAVLLLFSVRTLSPREKAESVVLQSSEYREEMAAPAAVQAAPAADEQPAETGSASAAGDSLTPTAAPKQNAIPTQALAAAKPKREAPTAAPTRDPYSGEPTTRLTATPAPTVQPRPTAAPETPAVVVMSTPAPTPTPVQTPVPAEPSPAATASMQAPAQEPEEDEEQPLGGEEGQNLLSAPEDSEAPAEETEAPAESEGPLMGLFGLFHLPAPAEESPAPSASPSPSPSPTPAPLAILKKDNRLKLQKLLSGEESPLPEKEEYKKKYELVLFPEDAYGSEERLSIRVYGEKVYYTSTVGEKTRSYLASCKPEELETLMKTLQADEAPSPSPKPSPSPTPTATP